MLHSRASPLNHAIASTRRISVLGYKDRCRARITVCFIDSADTIAATAAAQELLEREAKLHPRVAAALVKTFPIWSSLSKELGKVATKEQVSLLPTKDELLATKQELKDELKQELLAANLATKQELLAANLATKQELLANLATKTEVNALKEEVSKLVGKLATKDTAEERTTAAGGARKLPEAKEGKMMNILSMAASGVVGMVVMAVISALQKAK